MSEVLATGFFDGVHLGHREILRGATAALTFLNHPSGVLSPGLETPLLMDARSKIAAIKACGVEKVWAIEFTEEVAAVPPERFLEGAVPGFPLKAADIAKVKCGMDWRFGAGGKGDAGLLRSLGVEVEEVPYAEYKGERISSSRIRKALQGGRVGDANAMLGRRWTFRGRVSAGKGEGTKIGFPTVNIVPSRALPIGRGVYAVESRGVPAVANFGLAPTFGERAWKEPVLEVHFLSAPPPAENGEMEIEFVSFIRGEKAFSSPAELARQIEVDIAASAEKLAIANSGKIG